MQMKTPAKAMKGRSNARFTPVDVLRTARSFSWILAFTLAGCGAGAGNNNQKAEAARIIDRSLQLGEAKLTVSLPSQVLAGSAAETTITLRNQGKDQVYCTSMGSYVQELGVTIWDAQDKQPQFTELGSSLLNDMNRDTVYRAVEEALTQGQSKTWHVNLVDLYVLIPGQYTLTIATETGLKDEALGGVAPGRRFCMAIPFEVTSH
jgi:hypothetical protein